SPFTHGDEVVVRVSVHRSTRAPGAMVNREPTPNRTCAYAEAAFVRWSKLFKMTGPLVGEISRVMAFSPFSRSASPPNSTTRPGEGANEPSMRHPNSLNRAASIVAPARLSLLNRRPVEYTRCVTATRGL